MEREGGLAVDELVVSLPADVSVALAAKEVNSVDGAELEDIRPIEGSTYDPQLDVLETAAIVLGSETRADLVMALTEHVCRAVRSSWACVMERDGEVLASWGSRPNDVWLESFIAGSPGGETELPEPRCQP